MEKFKKIAALVMALVMVLAMSATALATATELEENGEEGVAGDWDAPDTERVQTDSVNIKKEIIAFNPNGTTVHAPVVTYTYRVTPATVTGLTVTDETTDHASGEAATVPVQAGLTTGLVVTGTAAGAAGDATSAVGTLVFTNASTWTTAAAGDTNEYDINLDFTNVNFTQPGVYRYQIVETIADGTANEDNYDLVAMEDGANNTLYLDVYVDGNLNIYGYVCMNGNASVTPATDTKINGFVDGTASDNSDKYYTYDLVLTKDVVNDTYAATNIAFPYTVIFNNNESYGSTFVIDQTVGTGSTGLNSSAATVTLTASAVAYSDVARVKEGNATAGTTVGDITLTGIPAGMDVDVYETNIATGVTYSVESQVTGTTVQTDNPVVWGSTPASAVAQTTKQDYESTKVTVNTTKIATTAAQSVDIINSLILISTTGYVTRIAPFAIILAAGVVILVLAKKSRKAAEE